MVEKQNKYFMVEKQKKIDSNKNNKFDSKKNNKYNNNTSIICNTNLFEMEGISIKTIVNFFAEKTNDDLKKILLVFFPLPV